jgi:acetyltransferase-like isoleucine patch superfamily enzyme
MMQDLQSLPNTVHLGDGHTIDANVFLGYLTGRPIDDVTLRIGPNAHIRFGTVIYAGTTIGANLQTGHSVVIREENHIGDGLNIWNNSTIDYGCQIGSGVKIHCNVYVAQFTTIEDDVFMAPGVMIANDPHPLCTLCMKGPTIKRRARIGINVTLLPHITIGEGALIGAGSVVTTDIPDYTVAYGSPARPVKSVNDLTCPFDLVDRPYVEGLDVKTRQAMGISVQPRGNGSGEK